MKKFIASTLIVATLAGAVSTSYASVVALADTNTSAAAM